MIPSLMHTVTSTAALALTLAACAGAPPRTAPEPAAKNPGRVSPADVHFMSAMIGHHSQALLMAGWAPSHGASSSVRTLAERIASGQQDEIVTMQQWLRDRGKPVPEAKAAGMKMMMNGH